MLKLIQFSFLIMALGACKASKVSSSVEMLGEEVRTIQNINEDWLYLENNTDNLAEAKAMNSWQEIDLPHTWNQWDVADQAPGYRRDGSWYKKNIDIAKRSDTQYLIYFEGANITTQVYVNQKHVGEHIGGYVGFEMDITEYLKPTGSNEISVRVDNRYNPSIIPSQKADFFIYGGIVRDVWLKTLPKNNIASVQISTPEVSNTKASTTAKIMLNQACDNCEYNISLIDPTNEKIILSKKSKADNNSEINLGLIDNPKLWSPKNPNLYKVKVELVSSGKVVDSVTETIGYRYFHFTDNGPFYINGERLLLRGTHRHEEHAGYGAAMPNSLHRADIQMMKDMGVNFLRLGHYPQDPEVYKACNELGIIVWDELPWCRGGMGGEEWKSNTRRLLQEQIAQNYNHPSILFWSLGNEIYWLPDFEGGDDRNKLNSFLTELNSISHEMDPGRMTSIRK